MSGALLVVWIALLGADRIDLAAGAAPVMVTPFLVLTPIVLALEAWRVLRAGGMRMPAGTRGYVATATVFLIAVLVSVALSLDLAVSARRFALLFLQVGAGLLVTLALHHREDGAALLVRGAFAGMLVVFAFDALQVAAVLGGWPMLVAEDAAVRLMPSLYGFIPRLSGPSLDANRGGMLILVYGYILATGAPPTRRRAWTLGGGAVAFLLTLSRSALLALGAGAATLLAQGARRPSRRAVTAAALMGAAGVALLMTSPAANDALAAVAEQVAPRFSTAEGSAAEHFRVLRMGVEVGARGPKEALVGVGHGNAYLTLQDVYGDNKYGNFHSLFVTVFAESGVVALVPLLVLLFWPMFRPGRFRPVLAGFIAFNVFYQSLVEPMFWLVIPLAWTGGPPARPAGPGSPASRSTESAPESTRLPPVAAAR